MKGRSDSGHHRTSHKSLLAQRKPKSGSHSRLHRCPLDLSPCYCGERPFRTHATVGGPWVQTGMVAACHFCPIRFISRHKTSTRFPLKINASDGCGRSGNRCTSFLLSAEAETMGCLGIYVVSLAVVHMGPNAVSDMDTAGEQ